MNIYKFLLLLCLFGISATCKAQGDPTDSIPDDPGALSVYSIQDMHFGAFSHGISGGSILISPAGMRSSSGSIMELDFGIDYYEAIFETAAPLGAIISISNGPDATLTGSNGGSMLLTLGDSYPAAPFTNTIASPARTAIHIGGALTVGNSAANPPGVYSGSFYVTFNLE